MLERVQKLDAPNQANKELTGQPYFLIRSVLFNASDTVIAASAFFSDATAIA
jgi:hypothetical protein